MLALTQALADEGKEHDIKAAAVCPAMVATPMTGVSGPDYLQPEDCAETVLYLLRRQKADDPQLRNSAQIHFPRNPEVGEEKTVTKLR